MATEYKITYTYTGQDNTSSARSVALSKFKKSGDTGRTIGQIKSIKYEHWHTSTKAASWALRGRLVLSDGTTFTSNTVTQTISGTKVKFTNTFINLPTPEQFAMVKTVQTLNGQGTTGLGTYSADLYWRANSDNPMRLIVTFIEEPPVVYAPKVDKFEVTRCNASGGADDEGQYIGTTLKLSIGDSAGLSGAQCKVYYAANSYPQVGVSQYVDLTSNISALMSGVELNTTLLTGVWNLGSIWNFAVVFTAGEETAIATASAARGTVNFHISGEPGGGAAVGGFSTGTTENPKFEAHVPSYFYGGISGVTNYSTDEVKTGGTWINGKPIYRKCISVSAPATSSGSTLTMVSSDVESWVNITGLLMPEGSAMYYPTCYYVSSSNMHRVWGNNGGALRYTSASKISGVVIVDYTKKTD